MTQELFWAAGGQEEGVSRALEVLGEEYPLRQGKGSPMVRFVPAEGEGALEVNRDKDSFTIKHSSVAAALRGVGAVLAGLPEVGDALSESTPFSTLGIMLDCSRNAVMSVPYLKKWLRRLALFGYNMVMLYTEDTYALPDEPFFGFLRGAYSPEELREVDDYAAGLGIEMVGCIQTLGHLEQILKWRPYSEVKDTSSVMLVDEDKTYDLIRKMVVNFAECFRSKRIHVGMDETHDLGRGRFMDLKGYERGFDIFNRHLGRVIGICAESGLKPMIWSDMYFRLGSKSGGYYDPGSVIPEDVVTAIPEGADLVYWDYYHKKESDYLGMIERHREMGREPVMASGVWTWARLWYDRWITEAAAGACVRACRKAGLRELLFTMWGDDGGYCEYDSSLAGLAWAADVSWSEETNIFRERFRAVCGMEYNDVLAGCGIEDPSLNSRSEGSPALPAANILWDDPLYGIHHLSAGAAGEDTWPKALEHFNSLADKLADFERMEEPVDMAHAAELSRFLAAKIDFRMQLEEAYRQDDREALESLSGRAAQMAEMTSGMLASFRRQWYRRNKPFGFEVIEIRLGGLKERYLETARSIDELLGGKRDTILELAEGLSTPREALEQLWVGNRYRTTAVPTSIL